jgi:hypothetical protein
MRRFQLDVGRAALRSLFEGVCSGVLGIAPGSLDDAELLAARLGIHDYHVSRRLRARGGLTCRDKRTRDEKGEPIQARARPGVAAGRS